MIVTIDGPAGAGKSSVARSLAERLGFEFLDTGAMYRAVAWAGLENDVDLQDLQALKRVAEKICIRFRGDRITVDDQDVSEWIRTQRVTDHVRFAASNPQVRDILVDQQRQIGDSCDNLVTEGRDQGTIVFPNAECKIFLTATAEERARRRYRQMIAGGEQITFAEVLESQNQRDAGDSQRDVAPMVKAVGAVEVLTDGMSTDEVLTHLQWIVESTR